MISLNDSKNIIKNEYGKNLSVLMIGHEDEDIKEYEDFFLDLFRDIVFINSNEKADEYWDNIRKNFDLVVVHLGENPEKAKDLITKIREEKESIRILVFSTSMHKYYNEANHCYCADATFPYPFDKNFSYRFLYRFLKRITTIKEMQSYIQILENIINPEEEKKTCFIGEDRRKNRGSIEDRKDSSKENKEKEDKIEKRRIEDNKLKNIRFNQSHKLTADEFMQSLDSTIVDKVEEFEEELDDYAMILYDIEKLDTTSSLEKILDINKILIKFSNTVENITAFPIIAETFSELTNFLSSLESESFEDREQKKLLVEVLLGLGKDLELWIKAIFIDRSTDDIHYFDASFANNCIEIEALFRKDEFESDDGDLEFF